MDYKVKIATKAILIGSQADELTGSVIPPIYQTSTFAQTSGEHKAMNTHVLITLQEQD